MRYIIDANRNNVGRLHEAANESNALDIIDDLCAAGFAITCVRDESGETIPPTKILDRLLAQHDVSKHLPLEGT